MMYGLYMSAEGARAQSRRLEVIANNLANVNTTGFKGSRVSFKFLEGEPEKNYMDPLPPANYKKDISDVYPLHGNDVGYVGIAGIKRDMAVGPANKTDNPLDVMIEFFRKVTGGELSASQTDALRASYESVRES